MTRARRRSGGMVVAGARAARSPGANCRPHWQPTNSRDGSGERPAGATAAVVADNWRIESTVRSGPLSPARSGRGVSPVKSAAPLRRGPGKQSTAVSEAQVERQRRPQAGTEAPVLPHIAASARSATAHRGKRGAGGRGQGVDRSAASVHGSRRAGDREGRDRRCSGGRSSGRGCR